MVDIERIVVTYKCRMVVFSTHKVVNSGRYGLIIVDNKKKYPFELDI